MNQRQYKWLPDNFPPVAGGEDHCSANADCCTTEKNAGADGQPRIAVVIHAFYPELLDGYITCLKNIPIPFDIFLTAPQEKMERAVEKLAVAFGKERVKALPCRNLGRDIAPFLLEAGRNLLQYDLVCKLHTKKSSHAQYGRDWAQGILHSLLGDQARVREVLARFAANPKLGVICPAYSALQIWGFNLPGAQILADKLGIGHDLQMNVFCAGSMFWFRPQALAPLLQYDFKYEDFPEEAAQEDGTLAHMIERQVLRCAAFGGYQWFELPADADSVDISAHWSHMMSHWKTLADYNRGLGLKARGELAACCDLPQWAREGAESSLPEVAALPLTQEWHANAERPFFSVMIPAYNPQERYLRETITSVLAAMPATIAAEIVVVDDCSTSVDVRAIVESCGRDRVEYVRNANNLGLLGNWHECIQRSKGQWLHILHQDDVVCPGYYQAIQEGLLRHPEAGMGFCRPSHIDENSQRIFEYWKERETPGIIDNWLISISRRLGVQFACIVVRRDVYAELGGFCQQADHASDWEMWIRIASRYPVFYEPRILASFRIHSLSESGRSSAASKNINDCRTTIEIASRYLPREYLHWLKSAREYYGKIAFNQAKHFAQTNQAEAARENALAGISLNPSPELKKALEQLIGAGNGDTDSLTQACARFAQDNPGEDTIERLRQTRCNIAQQIISCPASQVNNLLYNTPTGNAFIQLLNSGFTYHELTEPEKANVEALRTRSCDNTLAEEERVKLYLALMLYVNAYNSNCPPEIFLFATPLGNLIINYLLAAPLIFHRCGEAQAYADHLKRLTDYFCRLCATQPDSALTGACVETFFKRENFICAYFNALNQKDLYRNRAKLLSFFLQKNGFRLEHAFPRRKAGEKRGRLRVGFLNAHFGRQTETYTSLPFFEELDGGRFEKILLSLTPFNSDFAKYCQSKVDSSVVLPADDLKLAAQQIREKDLDFIIIGTNITAVTNPIAVLACHRLARFQTVSFSSPISTGMEHVDGYFTGTMIGEAQQEHHSEKLLMLEGAGFCFAYSADALPQAGEICRAQFGIPEDAVAYISGANFYKLIPEVRQAWATLLARNPKFVLVLVPFNAAWSNSYPQHLFRRAFARELAAAGANAGQLLILPQLPDRNALIKLIGLCDVYLDSFPYSGANSNVDPLEAGVPAVCVKGSTMRTGQGMAVLRSYSLDELVAPTVEDYLVLAHRLGEDKEYNQQMRMKIRQATATLPPLLDRKKFAEEVGLAIEAACGKRGSAS